MITDQRQRDDGEKELKVRIPARYRRRLHAIKALEGRAIKTMVRESLTLWFWVNGYPYDESERNGGE